MKTIAFILTMPHAASWNGKWSGDGKLFAKTRRLTDKRAQKVLENPKYYHHWSDGWTACVSVREVATAQESRNINKQSRGFAGYDWMIDSIVSIGEIRA